MSFSEPSICFWCMKLRRWQVPIQKYYLLVQNCINGSFKIWQSVYEMIHTVWGTVFQFRLRGCLSILFFEFAGDEDSMSTTPGPLSTEKTRLDKSDAAVSCPCWNFLVALLVTQNKLLKKQSHLLISDFDKQANETQKTRTKLIPQWPIGVVPFLFSKTFGKQKLQQPAVWRNPIDRWCISILTNKKHFWLCTLRIGSMFYHEKYSPN